MAGVQGRTAPVHKRYPPMADMRLVATAASALRAANNLYPSGLVRPARRMTFNTAFGPSLGWRNSGRSRYSRSENRHVRSRPSGVTRNLLQLVQK